MTNHDNERGGPKPTQIHQVTETPADLSSPPASPG